MSEFVFERVAGMYRNGWRRVDPEELIDEYTERLAIIRNDGGLTEEEARRTALACIRARFKIAERTEKVHTDR